MNSIDGIVWEADPKTLQFTFISKQAERLLAMPQRIGLSKRASGKTMSIQKTMNVPRPCI